MPLYEHVYLARQDVSAQQVEELTAQFKGVIEQTRRQGRQDRILGRQVPHLPHAQEPQGAFHAASTSTRRRRRINEIERQERLNEDVLRYLTIRVDEHEEGPSAMMRKSTATAIATSAVATRP